MCTVAIGLGDQEVYKTFSVSRSALIYNNGRLSDIVHLMKWKVAKMRTDAVRKP